MRAAKQLKLNNNTNTNTNNNSSDAQQMPSHSLSILLTHTTQEAHSTRGTRRKRHNTRAFFFNQLYKTT